jgi:polyribonucleotide 5'-hydroxyl-kinase
MRQYLAVHNALETQRSAAAASNGDGARVIIVGPADSGKSTLSRVLLSYAARMQRRPVFVDLDIGQGSAGVPGCLTAVNVDRPIDPEASPCQNHASGKNADHIDRRVSV